MATPVARTIERQGDSQVPYVRRWPDVTGGTCEFCGTIDNLQPAQNQYKLCPHYKNIGLLRCTYCPPEKDPDEIILHSKMTVYEHPNDPSKLVVCCNSYSCTAAHEKRFGARQ